MKCLRMEIIINVFKKLAPQVLLIPLVFKSNSSPIRIIDVNVDLEGLKKSRFLF